MKHWIAPSVLSADFLHLGEAINQINRSSAELIHIDVMDGVFVPNISYGFPIISQIASVAEKPLDVHLMITQPERYFERFREVGAQWLSVHYEASIHLHRSLNSIRQMGMKAGVVLNPHTPVSLLADIVTEADYVLLMSVNPGFGGQIFITNVIQKIRDLKELILRKNATTLIEIDGGVDFINAPLLVEAGADILVAGNTIFSHADIGAAIDKLHQLTE
ncbi:MAG: ribulose-phosphate 3-epimerase [Bacteroidales bacterium]|jgi:ribulose-phosphate 3-epimerase|nr:ribulose-phosphate 3-epimerase [Bacteroidales bacterium]